MTNLTEQIKALNLNSQLIMAYLTCERLYPNYVYFANTFSFGDPDILKKAIKYIYENLFAKNLDNRFIKTLISVVDTNTPKPGDFETILASSALDAGVAVMETLECMVSKDRDRICMISTTAIESVYMYIQDTENLNYKYDEDFDNKMYNHPLMEAEIKIQQGIIDYLNNRKEINYEDIDLLLQLQDIDRKGNLKLN